MPARSPHRPPSSLPAACSGRISARPRLVGVSTAKDLEMMGVLPGLAVPSEHGEYAASLPDAAGGASVISMMSRHIPRRGLGSAKTASAGRGDNGTYSHLGGRCHDVSYIRDKPGHGKQVKQGEWSDVIVPASKIPRKEIVVETSVLRKNDPSYEEWYEPAERLWHRIVFPAKRPSNREQVLLLERWMTMALAGHAEDAGDTETKKTISGRGNNNNNNSNGRLHQTAVSAHGNQGQNAFRGVSNASTDRSNAQLPSRHVSGTGGGIDTNGPTTPASPASAQTNVVTTTADRVGAHGGRAGCGGTAEGGAPEGEGATASAASATAEEARKAAKIRAQMNVLMVGFFEVIRQVTQHCAERGRLLDRIWRSLNELFEFVLWEMSRTVARCEERLEVINAVVEQERADRESRETMHKNELQLTEELINGRWSKKVRQLKDQEVRYGSIVAENERKVATLKQWLPNFETYGDSVVAKVLPPLPLPPPTQQQAAVVSAPPLSPQEALERDLNRIHAAGLWRVRRDDDDDGGGSISDSSVVERSSSSDSIAGSEDLSNRGGRGTSPMTVRTTVIGRSGTAQSGGGGGGGLQPPKRVSTAIATAKRTAGSSSSPRSASPTAAAAAAAGVSKTGVVSKRSLADGKMMDVLVQQGREAALRAEALRNETKEAEERAAKVKADAKEHARDLLQACGRAEGVILSLLADPAPMTPWPFPGLLELVGMKSLVDQVGVIRSSQGVLGIAGCHSCVIAAARALVAYRREAAAGGATSPSYRAVAAAATVPAASSLLRPRRLGQFLYETELRRSGRVGRARSAVRRLVASLLFWLPPPPPLSSPRARQLAASTEEAGVTAPAQPTSRPPGYGHLPRSVAGHEKTALKQFQNLLCARNGEGSNGDGSSTGGFGGRGEIDPSAASAHNSNAGDATVNPTESGSGDGGGVQDGFSEIEECLWLRVFAAVESHATPCRTEPRQGPTPAHLVPLDKAIASVEEIFGGEGESVATNAVAAAEMVKKHGASRRRGGEVASPWLFVDRAALKDTAVTITTAAAKHGGNQVELFDVTGAALTVGFRANRETLLRTLTLVTEVADLAGELTFGTVSVIMHVASPGLPEAALRHLFFQAATTGAPRPSSLSAARAGGDRGGQATAPAITTTSPLTRQRTSYNRNNAGRSGSFRQSDKSGGGGGGDGETTSASGLARAIVGFPLACEGLAPLVASTATELSARSLLKQVVHQAKEALEEAEKVVASIREAQGTPSGQRGGGGGGGFVPEAEISAVEARTSQLRAFMINADTSRSVLDVSKLWISRRMLVAEATLLRAYGGVGPTARAQDAIRQGRRVRLRRIFRAFETAWRANLMSRPPEETLETIESSDWIG